MLYCSLHVELLFLIYIHTDVFISELGNTVTVTNVEDSKGTTQYNFYNQIK